MDPERFARLAQELASRDRGLPSRLGEIREPAHRLRGLAANAVRAFRQAAREQGAWHLVDLHVGPVEPDEKHVDCLQVRIQRGRWEALVVVKAKGKATLVGPFRRGGAEGPCSDFALDDPAVGRSVEDLVEGLIVKASGTS
jgi:hypothetical protein